MNQLKGLTPIEVEKSRTKHGANLLTPPPATPLWRLYLEKFKDPIIMILLVATAISMVVGVMHGDFIESLGIIFAVLIATGVGFWQEYSAQKKFEAMRSDEDFEIVTVRRDGAVVQITKDQIVVGDIVILSAGDEVPADITLSEASEMKVSEAAMTGESVAVCKRPMTEQYIGSGYAPNQLLRGTTIEQGAGVGITNAVGDATEIGKTTRLASEETTVKTPLEQQLDGLAERITTASFIVAGLMLIILNTVHFGLGKEAWSWSLDTLMTEVQFLMGAVVVIIVAVPEGLPLSVTLALAFSMKTMAKEHNLVKKMHACETIGAVNLIFTDKTGTLTQNKMSVVESDVAAGQQEAFTLIGALNSTANWSADGCTLGNPTDSAILAYVGRRASEALRQRYQTTHTIPFSSRYKYMVVEVCDEHSGKQMIMIKGAPGIIARLISDNHFNTKIEQQQERGRRAIAAAMIHDITFDALHELLERGETIPHATYAGSWFIADPIRSDVPEAIGKCYHAGIDVVMMTGDNLRTGAEIAHQAGFTDLWAIEAKDFFEAIKEEGHKRAYPNVIARCTPTDKLEILQWAQTQHYVTAMTGDGVNDAPSLNYANVGIAMGSGTSVAKEAADIVLLNDAFPSIVTGVKWGRSLFKNIKNFLFFQLSINVSACLTAVFGPLLGVEMPFTVIQFLWINLVMDSFAAIALASEPADERVLREQPRDKNEFIINASLAKSIFGFGGFVFILCAFVLHHMSDHSPLSETITLTHFFAGYMVLNWWNIFNARVIGKHKSIFNGLFDNPKFWGITLTILGITILIVQLGGEVFSTQPLTWQEWGSIIAITSPVVILREIWHHTMRLFPKDR